MKDTLSKADNPKGVGLAAPQIGESIQIFVMKPHDKDPITVHINPIYILKSKAMVTGIPGSENRLEGCLSIPKIWGIVKRHKSVEIQYMNEEENKVQKVFSGFPAIIVQHEIDHLGGILFPKRVLEQNGKLFESTYDDSGKEVLEPMKL